MTDDDDSGMDELARVFNARQKHLIECERRLALALEALRMAPKCNGTACTFSTKNPMPEMPDAPHILNLDADAKHSAYCEHYRALRAEVLGDKP